MIYFSAKYADFELEEKIEILKKIVISVIKSILWKTRTIIIRR